MTDTRSRWRSRVAAAFALSSAEPALAAGEELWRGLTRNMPAEAVAEKLRGFSEIASIKVKPATARKAATLTIRYSDKGVDVFGQRFLVEPEIGMAGLISITLAATDLCFDDNAKLMRELLPVLKDKYPNHYAGPISYDEHVARIAQLKSASTGNSQVITTAFGNDQTTLVLVQRHSTMPYPVYVSGGGLARSLNDIAKLLYDSNKAGCGGTGDGRVAIGIKYMAKSDVDRLLEDEGRKVDQQTSAAKTGL